MNTCFMFNALNEYNDGLVNTTASICFFFCSSTLIVPFLVVWLSNGLVPSFLPCDRFRSWAKCGCNVRVAGCSWVGRRLENCGKDYQGETTLHPNERSSPESLGRMVQGQAIHPKKIRQRSMEQILQFFILSLYSDTAKVISQFLLII